MSSAERTTKKSKKRKHEEEDESHASPVKKSKAGLRNERRREKVKQQDHVPRDPMIPSDKHRIRKKNKRGIKRDKRKRHRDAATNGTLVEVAETGVPEDAIDHEAVDYAKEKKKQKKKAAEKRATRQRKQEENGGKIAKAPKPPKQPKPTLKTTWDLSMAEAGRFINHDPLFVRNVNGEAFLIAAVQCELHVLSLETSLVVRTMPAAGSATILAFAVESPESNLVYIADSDANMLIWDWTNDREPHFGPFSAGEVKALAALRLRDEDEDAETPYITKLEGHNVVRSGERNLYQTEKDLESIQVIDTEYTVVRGVDLVVIGRRKEDKTYIWVEVPLSKPTVCMDARMLPAPPGSKKAARRLPRLQLAIGYEDGQIHLHDDVSPLLSQGHEQALAPPRILHWHRSAVSAVKFNPDGSYLISGGKETVLVLWQLDTGAKQFLPHLTSEIERISVNPQGDRYALQMGDNSIMVLSTAELKPVANFAGLQLRMVGAENASSPAAVLHPQNPKRLLLTVPPTQPKSAKEAAPRPFLQTFDLHAFRHVTRQALTRNNTTDFNVGPEGNVILSPDVAHLAISPDGQWLATVDEWMPPKSDVAHLASSGAGIREAQRSQREAYLKIWHWHAADEIWTLSTRADSPHRRAGSPSLGAGRVLDLVSDPTSNCFVTVGEDASVKFWKPKTRIRGGVAMKDGQDVNLIEWSCRRSVQLSSSSPSDSVLAPKHAGAVAAWSNDGSLLAVSSNAPETLEQSSPAVTFIDTATGTIKAVNTALTDGTTIVSLAFLERHLITLTQKAAFIWDLVTDTMVRRIKLPHTPTSRPQLAINAADQTFALITPGEPPETHPSRVSVYSTRFRYRALEQEFETRVEKVLGGREGGRGFVVLFADATVRTISPVMSGRGGWGGFSAVLADSGSTDVVDPGEVEDDPIEGASLLRSAIRADGAGIEPKTFEVDEDDRPVVRPEQLASIFDGYQSFAMPPVKDMFQAVVGLFRRKPEPRGTISTA